MVLFRRKKTEDINPEAAMPQELQDYYQAETRERTWMAWVLGLTTLVVTVVLALGLFYGGRYAYRKIRGNDNQQTAVQQADNAESEDTEEDTQDSPADESDDQQTAQAPTSTPTTQTPSPNTSSTSTSTPRTASPRPSTMPSTGPSDTLAVFVAVSVLGYAVHRRFLSE